MASSTNNRDLSKVEARNTKGDKAPKYSFKWKNYKKSIEIITDKSEKFVEELKEAYIITFTHPDGTNRYGIIVSFRFSGESPPTSIFYKWFRYSKSKNKWYWHQSEIPCNYFHEYTNFKLVEDMTPEEVEAKARAGP